MSDRDAREDGDANVGQFRESLDAECRGCGKPKDEANEIAPVAHGQWSFGPEWSCGNCLPKEVSADA